MKRRIPVLMLSALFALCLLAPALSAFAFDVGLARSQTNAAPVCSSCGAPMRHLRHDAGGCAWICESLGCELAGQEVVLQPEPEVIPGKEPTCTEDGHTESTVCALCGAQMKTPTVLPKLGHKPVSVPGKSPTCTEDGYTESSVCSVCSAVVKPREILPMLGHSYVESDRKEPTCTAAGSVSKTCSRCGSRIVVNLGSKHSYIEVPLSVLPLQVCTVCGETRLDKLDGSEPASEKEAVTKAVLELISEKMQEYYGNPIVKRTKIKSVEVSPGIFELNVDETPAGQPQPDTAKFHALHTYLIAPHNENGFLSSPEPVEYRIPVNNVNEDWLKGKEFVFISGKEECNVLDGQLQDGGYVFKCGGNGIAAFVEGEALKQTVEKAVADFNNKL